MDRNQIIGIVLITFMMLGYLAFQETVPTEIANEPLIERSINDDTGNVNSSTNNESSSLATSDTLPEQLFTVSNEDVIITFSNKGTSLKKVILKNHLDYHKDQVVLIDEKSHNFEVLLPTTDGNVVLNTLNYEPSLKNNIEVKGTDSLQVRFTHNMGNGKLIEQVYTIRSKGYDFDYDIITKGLVLKENAIIDWTLLYHKIENYADESINKSSINYYLATGSFDDIGSGKGDKSADVEESIKWISHKQRFFNSAIIAKESFTKANLATTTPDRMLMDTLYIKKGTAKLSHAGSEKMSFTFYIGPNDYNITKTITDGFEKNVYLGWAVFGWINKFLILPIFRVLESFISNYGVIILLLVIIIKTLLFPIAYRSYLSMATMRELKPELDAIKERCGDDAQKAQQEQMKLYNQVGVNPISGCIPMLLQMPILLALFNFFPNSIELRHQAFLWAHDLSTYDAPILLPFTIPFYGSHVSLFTLLMTLSTIAYTYYNNQVSAATGPMKSVGYVMPVIFMFVLNNFSSGLTFYYFVSNLITISQQLLATNFIDKNKIRKKLEENKKAAEAGTRKKSKFQQRLEDAMKAQQEQDPRKKKK